jgi:hypothetical protein
MEHVLHLFDSSIYPSCKSPFIPTAASFCFTLIFHFPKSISFYLFFPSVSPLVCAYLFFVLRVFLYLFSPCRPSHPPFCSKIFLSINRISGVKRSMGNGKIVVVFFSDDISRMVWRYLSCSAMGCSRIIPAASASFAAA